MQAAAPPRDEPGYRKAARNRTKARDVRAAPARPRMPRCPHGRHDHVDDWHCGSPQSGSPPCCHATASAPVEPSSIAGPPLRRSDRIMCVRVTKTTPMEECRRLGDNSAFHQFRFHVCHSGDLGRQLSPFVFHSRYARLLGPGSFMRMRLGHIVTPAGQAGVLPLDREHLADRGSR